MSYPRSASSAPRKGPCYANGERYRPLYSTQSQHPRPFGYHNEQVIALTSLQLDWPRFWEICVDQLKRHGYGPSTTELYRYVLRSFYKHDSLRPAAIDAASVQSYIHSLVDKHYSGSWISMNISILRTLFDKLSGQNVTAHLVAPKRPERLPEILSPREVREILASAPTTRDQLLLGLMYGCGLKVGELCRLTWADVDAEQGALRVCYARGTRQRTLDLPPDLLPVLKLGSSRCPQGDYIFQGRVEGTHLSTRMVELILRRAAEATSTLKTVTCMTLRHSYAVHCIEQGDSVRAVQEALGHASIDTTQRYEDCILPKNVISPLAALRQREAEAACIDADHLPEREPPEHTSEALFDEPLSTTGLELPFRDNSTDSPAVQFYHLLKARILGRFLCRRGATARAG
jgi:integrase/recombinase XerD